VIELCFQSLYPYIYNLYTLIAGRRNGDDRSLRRIEASSHTSTCTAVFEGFNDQWISFFFFLKRAKILLPYINTGEANKGMQEP
jgi:hypothetical protein